MPVDSPLVGLVRQRLSITGTLGVAVSGGVDSTALLHLTKAAGFQVEAVTVDHRLRPESAAEAALVAKDCARMGIPHRVQVWDHGPLVPGNLMDAARQARMALITDWARDRGIAHVALGHTQDDQAETVLMGLARQAGVAGLSGMRPWWQAGGITFHRPLLEAGRDELRDWLQSQGIGWLDDPTNEDPRFTRIKARKALAALAPLGITAAGLAAVAGHLASAQAALTAMAARAAGQHVALRAGAVQITAGLFTEPTEVQRLIVARAIDWLRQEPCLLRADDLRRFQDAVRDGRDATLAGCRHRGGWVFREARALGPDAAVGALWDRRWNVTGPPGTVSALGEAGLRACPDWRATGLPRQVLAVTPAVWREGALVSAPLAGWENGWTARVAAADHLFGLSD